MRRRSMGRSSGCSAGRSSDTCSPARGRRAHPSGRHGRRRTCEPGDGSGDGHTIRYRIRTLSGTYRWIEDIVNVVKNDRGEVTHTRGVCRDVSEAVAASRFAEQYVQFIDSLPLGVMILELVVPGDSTSFVVRAEDPSVEPFGPSSMASPIGQRLIDARPGAFHGRRGDDDAGLVEVVADAVQDQRPAFIESLDLKSATGSNCTYRSGSHR